MPDTPLILPSLPHLPLVYEIRVQGHLGHHWADGFEGLTLTLEDNGNTLLIGPVADQAALYGLLHRVRDLGMILISVMPINLGPTNTPKLLKEKE